MCVHNTIATWLQRTGRGGGRGETGAGRAYSQTNGAGRSNSSGSGQALLGWHQVKRAKAKQRENPRAGGSRGREEGG